MDSVVPPRDTGSCKEGETTVCPARADPNAVAALSGASVDPSRKLAADTTRRAEAALGAMGWVAASMDSRNWTSCCRLAASCRLSTPPVPAERCATFCITASSDSAEPSWKNVCGNAKSDSSEGGRSRRRRSRGAPFGADLVRELRMNVPTLRQLRDELAAGDQAGVGRGIVAHPAGAPLRAAVATLAVGLDEQLPARDDVGIGRFDAPAKWARGCRSACKPRARPRRSTPRTLSWLRPPLAAGVRLTTFGVLRNAVGVDDQSLARRRRHGCSARSLPLRRARRPVQARGIVPRAGSV